MRGLAWKIALLTAVLAVGFLVILQAQRGMTQAMLQKEADAQAAAKSPTAAAPASDEVAASSSAPKADSFGDATPIRDAAAAALSGPNGNNSKTGNDIKTVPPLSDSEVAAKDAPKPPDKGAAVANSKEAALKETAANDPFADGSDAKHSAPALEGKPAAGLEVKQASASTDAGGKRPDQAENFSNQPIPIPDANGPKLPTADGPGLGDAKPGDAKFNSTKPNANAPPKQSEPPAAPQIEPPVDQKPADQKSSGGPQLPGAGPALDLPPTGNGASQTDPKSSIAPPALDAPADAKPLPVTQPEPADKPPMKSPAADPAGAPPAAGPKPFPDEGPKESPLPAPALPAPSAGASNPTTTGPPVFDLTPPNSSGSNSTGSTSRGSTLTRPAVAPPIAPEIKSVDAGNASSAAPRSATESHSETPADFQGDGTVGDAAPLGPQRPQLNIEKIAPPNALLGQPLIYSILVKNVGQSAARDVVIEDRIPKGTKLSGTIPRAELTGKKLIWRIGTLGGGEQRKISIRVIPQEAGEIGSVATVNFVAEAAAETVVTAPRLEFKISAPSAARLGELVPFHFEVKNVGTGEARGVVIRDLIPDGLSHSAGHDLEYEVGRLMPGKSKQLTLDLKAGKVGTAVNRAVVLADGGLTTEAKAAIEISGSKVALSRSGPQRRYMGRQAVFTNTLVNESSFAVDGAVLVETIPAGMEFAGASHGGQYNDGSRTIAWRIDQMAPGETRVVKSRLVARGVGNQTTTVRLTIPNGEPVEATSQTEVEGFAAMGVEVSGVDGPVDLGEKITLHVNARNKGTVAVTNLVVTVEIPEQLEVVTARGPGKTVQEPGRIKFGPVPTLEGRTSAACEIVLTARKRGDSRVRVSIQADQIDKPLAREESILILSESPEPSAARATR
jgi:uncharacterized repeat protein (TIGR01451 family)